MYRFRGLAYLNLSLQVNPRPAPHVLPPRRLFFFFFLSLLAALCPRFVERKAANPCRTVKDISRSTLIDTREKLIVDRSPLAVFRFIHFSPFVSWFVAHCYSLFHSASFSFLSFGSVNPSYACCLLLHLI